MRIVLRRLKDKGRILIARSYADWGRWTRFKQGLVEQGVTMVELTSHGMQDKNRADIALAVDAMELAYTRPYVDTFVILSGDSDFTPLVMRLKELNKRVIGCGTRGSTSRLIAETCDEFFFYDTLRNESRLEPAKPVRKAEEPVEEEDGLTLDEAFELLVETVENHQRDEPNPVHASVLKASMKRKEPTFSEMELGMRTFARFLETAQQKGLVSLTRDERAGGLRVDLPQDAAPREAAPGPRRAPTAALSPEAQRLQGLLAEAGLEIGDPVERRLIVEQFVATCAERARRNRSCAVQFVLGDLLRRVKQESPDVAPRSVKAVVHAILRAGLLIHPNGEAARASTAPFVAPVSAPQLLDELHAAGLRVLQSRDEDPDATVLTELFVGTAGERESGGSEPQPGNGRDERPRSDDRRGDDRRDHGRGEGRRERRPDDRRGTEPRGAEPRAPEPRSPEPRSSEETPPADPIEIRVQPAVPSAPASARARSPRGRGGGGRDGGGRGARAAAAAPTEPGEGWPERIGEPTPPKPVTTESTADATPVGAADTTEGEESGEAGAEGAEPRRRRRGGRRGRRPAGDAPPEGSEG